jgi:hypothetical protein
MLNRTAGQMRRNQFPFCPTDPRAGNFRKTREFPMKTEGSSGATVPTEHQSGVAGAEGLKLLAAEARRSDGQRGARLQRTVRCGVGFTVRLDMLCWQV